MAIAIDRRPYDVFLSHAHADAEFAAAVNRWLTAAGFRVWFDARAMAPSNQINRALEEGIGSSRALIVLASRGAVDKPFMLQSAGQLEAYRDDVERIALIRRLAADFRRRIYD